MFEFYKVEFNDSSLDYKNGYCEDLLIVSSNGTIKKIIIENSISDGLDVDFSELLLNYVKINNSLNDCADFSFGDYFINDISVLNCGDKGISIGEKSKIKILNTFVSDSYIGISVKDFSQLNFGLLNSEYIYVLRQNKRNKNLEEL